MYPSVIWIIALSTSLSLSLSLHPFSFFLRQRNSSPCHSMWVARQLLLRWTLLKVFVLTPPSSYSMAFVWNRISPHVCSLTSLLGVNFQLYLPEVYLSKFKEGSEWAEGLVFPTLSRNEFLFLSCLQTILFFFGFVCSCRRPRRNEIPRFVSEPSRWLYFLTNFPFFLPCLVLSCLVLSCLVLSCLVLPCLVLSWLGLAWLGLSCLVLSCLVLRDV